MIPEKHPVFQAFLGTLLTWGLTAAGSAVVFIFINGKFAGRRKFLDGSLGFAAGVMIAASYWSLLAPAIEMSENSGTYGASGGFIPATIGFLLGGGFVLLSDICLPRFTKEDPAVALALFSQHKKHGNCSVPIDNNDTVLTSIESNNGGEEEEERDYVETEDTIPVGDSVHLRVRNRKTTSDKGSVVLQYQIETGPDVDEAQKRKEKYESWKRILLLIIAITVHNIPEGLAVGVAFGAIGSSESATFGKARSLAIGIGIQNFPEGMAVSIPLSAAGYSPLKSFWYGQLSGMVEPIFGVLGSLLVVVAEPILPYALGFAAGAMIYVVVDDIIPEANMCGNGRIASWGTMIGFVVMMCLDVALG